MDAASIVVLVITLGFATIFFTVTVAMVAKLLDLIFEETKAKRNFGFKFQRLVRFKNELAQIKLPKLHESGASIPARVLLTFGRHPLDLYGEGWLTAEQALFYDNLS